jgi:hypothetical protein
VLRPDQPQPGQGVELGRRPLTGDHLPAERGAVAHRPVFPGPPHPATLEVAGVTVEEPVIGVAVSLGREQARAVGARHAAADEVDVRLLAGLQHPKVGVDRGQLGDQPFGVRLGPAQPGVPGRPAVPGLRFVEVGVGVHDRRGAPEPLQSGRFLIIEAALAARAASGGLRLVLLVTYVIVLAHWSVS